MSGSQEMLDAHVRFELDRISGAGLARTVAEETSALFDWLRTVRVADVLPDPEATGQVAVGIVEAVRIDERSAELLAEAVVSVHRTLLADASPISELVADEDFDALVAVLVTMRDARRELLDVLTTSDAYTRLVSHVLYHGVKSYVLTENVVARRVPGAQSLMALGQRGLNRAVPSLEGQVDRQLLAFVQANITDTLRESQRYLDQMLDDELISAMAREAWQAHRNRSAASVAGLVTADQLAGITGPAAAMWEQLRSAGLVRRVVRTIVMDLLERHGERTVGGLIDEAGLTEEWVAEQMVETLRPAVEHARDDGFLEARIRARLEPFYAQYAERPPSADHS